ncbi:hypothetical protein SISNIDRAFT_458459 [Sistotremastrum niveocremeum HHB9708]|uniref:ABM domain-containing protein n=1 Tax=Sistotremastrum niveocremeum HHB9708 TaxID=1314777 RepID=A0A164QLM6_9AGAM|nr:hypothetical protein SISNIDRAFT_458459 [Sistotremastrum niveocremeum HHB9708]
MSFDSSPNVTEFLSMTLKAEHISDQSELKSITDVVEGQRSGGFQAQYLGFRLEQPDILQWFLNWDKLEDHKAFMASATYGPFKARAGGIRAAGGIFEMVHVPLSPWPPIAFEAPVTEVQMLHLKPGYSWETFKEPLLELVNACQTEGPGAVAGSASSGVAVEDEKLIVTVAGWDSAESHKAFAETERFKELAIAVREQVESKTSFHVTLTDRRVAEKFT